MVVTTNFNTFANNYHRTHTPTYLPQDVLTTILNQRSKLMLDYKYKQQHKQHKRSFNKPMNHLKLVWTAVRMEVERSCIDGYGWNNERWSDETYREALMECYIRQTPDFLKIFIQNSEAMDFRDPDYIECSDLVNIPDEVLIFGIYTTPPPNIRYYVPELEQYHDYVDYVDV